jgi:hypothetical protein
MKNYADFICSNLEKIFKENILCVLLLGSVQKDDTTPFSDIDLIAIIKEFDLSGITNTRNMIRQSEILVDLSFLCWNEIPKDPNKFSLGTHGCYQLGLVLKQANCLSGKNVLLDLGMPSEENIRQSLFQKIVQYTWWARRKFVESNRAFTLEDNYQINSRLIKMIRGLLYLNFNCDIHAKAEDAILRFAKEFSNNFSQKEKDIIFGLVSKSLIVKNTANLSEKYLSLRILLINKIHKLATESFYNS